MPDPRFERVQATLREASGVEFTAAVARIEHRGRLVFERAYGSTRTDARMRPVYCDTRFDLASLTKLFVSTLALQAVASGNLSLDEPLGRLLPEWSRGRRREVTARMLLAHNSGMNSGADYRAIRNENVEQFALRSRTIAHPGERVLYSDLGFIALGVALERAEARSLAALAGRTFSGSLGFRPRAAARREIPATEEDGWRGRVQGFVHDEKAFLMGGVAGHAGLFGTAADVAALTEAYLGPLHGRHAKLLPERLVREAISEQAGDPVLRRGLGWALRTSDANSCGRYVSHDSFGHTGFVGTCVWADPARDVQGVLLTNALYFGRNPPPNAGPALRTSFYEAMIEDLGA
ncbi:MAG: serine hydrolase [Candidatus Baltobacteraceae bacterium]